MNPFQTSSPLQPILTEPGMYVIAVSGGVDSMVLLDMLRQRSDVQLVVAHFDHGIREDSAMDRRQVQTVTESHGLPFVYDEGRLGTEASEDTARQARYAFLKRVQDASGAQAIITAHHQDDLLETAVLNMLRGTARRGLTSLRSHEVIRRPLLHVPKAELIAYAKNQGLVWREDSTNQDTRHRRNYVRHQLLPRFSPAQRKILLSHIHRAHELHEQLEAELINHLHLHPKIDELDRHWFIMLPHLVSREILATWLRRRGVKDLSSQMLERLTMAAKTFAPGRIADIDKAYILRIDKDNLALKPRER